jgi:L-aminopeptidase/D-esterase-like protein
MRSLRSLPLVALSACAALLTPALLAHAGPRARDLGVPFVGTPGEHNAITDVKGVEVGHTTIIAGKGRLKVGEGPVRTGVTAIWPRGKKNLAPVFAGCFSLNGNGEITGTARIQESGFVEGPIVLTNTHSVGSARDAVFAWLVRHGKNPELRKRHEDFGALPLVAGTWDGELNDIKGFHVKQEHAREALDKAKSGQVAEGNVAGDTGMTLFDLKGGIGTSSRRFKGDASRYTFGVLAQCNFGNREQLLVAGVPMGREIPVEERRRGRERGSIIVVVATDAPLLPHQLKRIARRTSHGLAQTGSKVRQRQR